jgi:hypothetical protein
MGWKETWQHFKENLTHHGKAEEERSQEQRQAKEWDEAQHQSDKSSGSETLDDQKRP